MQQIGDKKTSEVRAAIAELPSLPLRRLRALWKDLHARDAPSAFGFDLLRRGIAYKIQENAFGGLSLQSLRALNQLKKSIEKNPNGYRGLSRRLQSGCVLVREWRGRSYRVTVTEKGFESEGRSYSTLSQIAREITGTNWNGPRFFGLRKSERLARQISNKKAVERKVAR